MNKLIACLALAVVPTFVGADDHQPKFSDKPIWVSGSQNCGGDGNARLLEDWGDRGQACLLGVKGATGDRPGC